MKRFHVRLVCGAAVATVLLVAIPVFHLWWSLRPVSLADWVQRVQRPGYNLIYSTEAADHSYYAIFDAGDDRIGFCHLDKTHHPATTLSIVDLDGHDLLDVQNRRFRALTRNILGIYGVIDGTELPIKRGLAGKIRLKLVDLDKGDDLLEVEIPWRPAPSQSVPKQKGRGCATEFAPTARNGHRS